MFLKRSSAMCRRKSVLDVDRGGFEKLRFSNFYQDDTTKTGSAGWR